MRGFFRACGSLGRHRGMRAAGIEAGLQRIDGTLQAQHLTAPGAPEAKTMIDAMARLPDAHLAR